MGGDVLEDLLWFGCSLRARISRAPDKGRMINKQNAVRKLGQRELKPAIGFYKWEAAWPVALVPTLLIPRCQKKPFV